MERREEMQMDLSIISAEEIPAAYLQFTDSRAGPKCQGNIVSCSYNLIG